MISLKLNLRRNKRRRGIFKVVILRNNDTCPDIIVVSVDDIKHVHLFSTMYSGAQWKNKSRIVYDKSKPTKVYMKFKKLNLIDMCNNGLDEVDISD